MGGLLAGNKKLEGVLKEKSTVKAAKAGEYALTFSSIHYNGFEILCQIESRFNKDVAEWRLQPLGVRVKKRDFML